MFIDYLIAIAKMAASDVVVWFTIVALFVVWLWPSKKKDEEYKKLYETCQVYDLLEELRQGMAETVMFHQPNDDFTGPAEMIVVNGEWTDYKDKRFKGDSLRDCLWAAVVAKRLANNGCIKEFCVSPGHCNCPGCIEDRRQD